MAGFCGCDPLDRLCRRASERCTERDLVWPGPAPGGPCCPVPRPCPCRQVCFWPCFCACDLIEARRPKPCCQKCGCSHALERQGRYVRCCECGWIGVIEDCMSVCRVRSCCDNLLWPEHGGAPR